MVSALPRLCVLLAVLHAAHARSWNPFSYPNPHTNPGACGRLGVARSSVCDPDGLLTRTGADVVEGVINRISQGKAPYAPAPCEPAGVVGFQVGVALMRQMDVQPGEDPGRAAQEFARVLHDAWGVGGGDCQNGVLLLMSVLDRQMYISTGAAAAARASDAQLQVVMDSMKPLLRDSDFDGALRKGVEELGLALTGAAPKPAPSEEGGAAIVAIFFSIIASVIGWNWYSNRHHQRRFKSCQDKLAAIRRDQEAVRRNAHFAAATCPICLEDIEARPPAAQPQQGKTFKPEGGGKAGGESGSARGEGRFAPLVADELRGSQESVEVASLLAKAAAGGSSGSARRPLVLRCGHSFCEHCITQWVSGHTTCPICRKHIDNDEDDPPYERGSCAADAASAAADAARRQAQRRRDHVYVPELGFRLRQLQRQYPMYIPDSMLAQWESDLMADRMLDSGSLSHHQREATERLARDGAGGASHSWGGGSSRGGGGAGSSW